ncbi:MAG: adenylyltransferase/cytidyltransferase family protein [Firmicutes bacterium]|nr:adenylyltransferase/cytidyltransferase family protein [Bacillota bacterium]
MKIGYTGGVYDLLHVGHLSIFKNAKQHCDYLIVGVNSDELVKKYKNKTPAVPLEERMELVEAVKYVDAVIPRHDLEKVQFSINNKIDIVFIGSDWKGNERWARDEAELNKHGIELVYLPLRNKEMLSTTKLISKIQSWLP